MNISKFFKNSVAGFLIINFITACSPGFNTNIGIEPIIYEHSEDANQQEANPLDELSSNPKIRIGDIADKRNEQQIVVINERKVFPKDNLPALVQEGIRKKLIAENFQHSLLANCKIEGEIKRWTAQITPAFPMSEIKAEAELKLSITDQNRKYYDGTYSGEMGFKHPNLSEKKTSEILSETMGQAILQAFGDAGFEQKLLECGGKR